MVYKMNESIIVIQAEATSPNRTNVVFWSHDRGTAKLRMKLVRKNGIPQSLPEGTTVPIRLMFKSATAEGGYGKHDYLATIEDRVNGIVSIVLEDNILGYVGTVEGSVYIDFPNDRSLDTAGRFTFTIRRSPIDETTSELEDYYFNGFSQTIDKIEKIMTDGKQAIDQKIADSEQQINEKLEEANNGIVQANQNIETLSNEINEANDRIDLTNQQIGNLGKLKKMYSNSIDFGDYDYNGNPNLIANINTDSFSQGIGALSVVDDGDEVVVTLDPNHKLDLYKVKSQPALVVGETYTMSVEIMLEDDFTGDPSKIALRYYRIPHWVPTLTTPNTLTTTKGVWQKLTVTAKMTTAIDNAESWYVTLYNQDANNSLSGRLRLRHAKLEAGSTATPYQPNLLDAPYYLSKVPLGENILRTDVGTKLPITTTEYQVANFVPNEPYVVGQKYTFTMKATKPATQYFAPHLRYGSLGVGSMTPVDGLTDVWQITYTVTQEQIDNGANAFNIFQMPQSTKGTVNIEWAKLEKGDTRTPNISQFKYFGEGLKDSNNPNDYSWDVTPEYTEKGLNDSVSLTEPQSVDGTKNFLETPLVNGKNVLVEEKPLPYEAWHSTGTEQTGISNKARLIIGPVATTIGAKLNRSMKENPLTWNSGNWQATANRDCTLLVEGLVRYQFGGSTAGQYGYITFYKDDGQNSSIGFAGGVGINGTALQWKHGLHFSRIFALKKGEFFNITFETQDGKKLDFSQINTLHIMEIES
ncbi:BppU family phage baseplate upper protein [Enterococcus mundtii]|uniref:BppU family phage baseplate upper protein n=1 Tax=Enterococcus mundtii TaxID=53346 RepID=UPI0038FCCD11